MSRRKRLATAFTQGLAAAAGRAHVVGGLLLVNLLVAWVLAAPLKGVLADNLDLNLYSDTMATGASWRWFDTVDRLNPAAFGNLDAWQGLLSPEGVKASALGKLSGTALAVVLAGLFLFWANAVFHCGFLATLQPAERRLGFGASCAHLALPASALSFFALLSYLGVYALCYVQTGKWLEPWRGELPSEGVAIALTWARLAVTGLGLLVVKTLFDLGKIALATRGNWNWPWAFFVAASELARRSPGYLLLSLGMGALVLPLSALWWATGGLLHPQGSIGLLILFVLHQLFVAARIFLRLAHLGAAHSYFQQSRTARASLPYKVDPA
ncbi:MAG: hypothetical protein U0002_09650 [Thermoanaerobaculia bacterium]